MRTVPRTIDGAAKHAQGCLFCRRTDRDFKSREHILSEALGNHTYVLEPGIVCDRCNNGPLSRVDGTLIDLPPVTLRRAELGLPTKAGKGVMSKWGNARIAFSGPGEMELHGASRKVLRDMPRGGRFEHGERRTIELTTGGPMTTDRLRDAVRSVWKSALELVYWDLGPEAAFARLFDGAREAIIDDGKVRGWAVVPKHARMRDQLQLTYALRIVDGRFALCVRMDILGLEVFTDLLRRDLSRDDIDPPFKANVWVF